MTYKERIAVLQEQHARLSKQVEVMENTPGHNHEDLVQLKKKKLEIKDEISRLNRLQFEERERINWDEDR